MNFFDDNFFKDCIILEDFTSISPMTHQSTVTPVNSVTNDDIVISFKNVYHQIFDFPFDVIKHILGNAHYNVVKKLYFTCKYFPAKFRLFLVDTLEIDTLIFKHSRIPLSTTLLKDKEVWLGHDIYFANKLHISTLASKVEKCTIKTFQGNDFLMSWNDFKILAEARTIEQLEISDIVDTNGQNVVIEDICNYTPNLNYFESMFTHVTPNSFKIICNSLMSTNMKRFTMNFVDGLLNVKDYLKFIKIRPKAVFSVLFDLEEHQIKEFYAAVKSEIQTWPEPKPYFY